MNQNRRISGPIDDVMKTVIISDTGVKSFKEDLSIVVTQDTDLPTQYKRVKTIIDNYMVIVK